MGKVLRTASDPPGQRSVYVNPGNWEIEAHRLATFDKFPDAARKNIREFSKSGFYYTGFKDRVKCHGCGVCVEQWLDSDDPAQPHWHDQDCPFRQRVSGLAHASVGQPSNVSQQLTPSTSRQSSSISRTRHFDESQLSVSDPIALHDSNVSNREATFPCNNPVNPHMSEENARLQTFRDRIDHWPSHRIRATPQEIAHAGLYYLGQGDRVKCWYCNGGLQNWEIFDNPWFEHAKWFPIMKKLWPHRVLHLSPKDENLLKHLTQNKQLHFKDENLDQLQITQCLMSFTNACGITAEKTNKDEISRKPITQRKCHKSFKFIKHKATEMQNVKIVLKEAKTYDVAQQCTLSDKLHAIVFDAVAVKITFSPREYGYGIMCEFVLQRKGLDYVHQIVTRFPNINRPEIPNPVHVLFGADHPTAALVLTNNIEHMTRSDEAPKVVDPRKHFKEINDKIRQEMASSKTVQQAREMGFTDQLIRSVLRRRFELQNNGFDTLQSMIEELLTSNLDEEDQSNDYYDREDAPSGELERMNSIACSSAVDDIKNTLQEIEHLRKCRICTKNSSNIVLLPCGHIASCESCVNGLKACPICKLSTQNWVKSYSV